MFVEQIDETFVIVPECAEGNGESGGQDIESKMGWGFQSVWLFESDSEKLTHSGWFSKIWVNLSRLEFGNYSTD